MGWTIDVSPTATAAFASALDAAKVREFPEGSPLIYARDANGHWDKDKLRPEVAEQIASAIADAKRKARKLKGAAVSASLIGHVRHLDPAEIVDNGETYVRVDLGSHGAELLEASA